MEKNQNPQDPWETPGFSARLDGPADPPVGQWEAIERRMQKPRRRWLLWLPVLVMVGIGAGWFALVNLNQTLPDKSLPRSSETAMPLGDKVEVLKDLRSDNGQSNQNVSAPSKASASKSVDVVTQTLVPVEQSVNPDKSIDNLVLNNSLEESSIDTGDRSSARSPATAPAPTTSVPASEGGGVRAFASGKKRLDIESTKFIVKSRTHRMMKHTEDGSTDQDVSFESQTSTHVAMTKPPLSTVDHAGQKGSLTGVESKSVQELGSAEPKNLITEGENQTRPSGVPMSSQPQGQVISDFESKAQSRGASGSVPTTAPTPNSVEPSSVLDTVNQDLATQTIKQDSLAQPKTVLPAEAAAKSRKVGWFVGAGGMYLLQYLTVEGSPSPTATTTYRLQHLSDAPGVSAKVGAWYPLSPTLRLLADATLGVANQRGTYIQKPGPGSSFSIVAQPSGQGYEATPAAATEVSFSRYLMLAGLGASIGWYPGTSPFSLSVGGALYASRFSGERASMNVRPGLRGAVGYRLSTKWEVQLTASSLALPSPALPMPLPVKGSAVMLGLGVTYRLR